jgi:hypothetical protein
VTKQLLALRWPEPEINMTSWDHSAASYTRMSAFAEMECQSRGES